MGCKHLALRASAAVICAGLCVARGAAGAMLAPEPDAAPQPQPEPQPEPQLVPQPEPARTPDALPTLPQAAMDDRDALAGPRVRDSRDESIVRTDMQGRFERLRVRPEVEAITALDLDTTRRERARAIIDARAEAIALHLAQHIDIVREWTDAQRDKDNAKARRLQQRLHELFEAPEPRDPLAPALRALLTPEESVRFERMLDEYWAAWLDNEAKARPKDSREKARARLLLDLFQGEVGQAYEVSLRPYQRRLERLYQAVDAPAELRESLRDAVVDFIRETRLSPSDDQKRALARRIYDLLDEDRRVRLVQAAVDAF